MVDIDAAETVCVAEDGDAGVVLDVPDQLVRATGDHEVDMFVQVKKRGYNVPCGDELYRGIGDKRIGQGLGYGYRDGLK